MPEKPARCERSFVGLYFDNGMIRVRKWEKPKGSLAKGSWHAGGVTEGFHSRHFPKSSKPMWRGTLPIAPSGRELSPQVTEGASGGRGCGLLWGWYLLVVVVTSTSTAVTIPGIGGAVTI